MQAKKERIETAALVAEIVGAIAVVISVIYLAAQIAESNKELRSQTHFNAKKYGCRCSLRDLILCRSSTAYVEHVNK